MDCIIFWQVRYGEYEREVKDKAKIWLKDLKGGNNLSDERKSCGSK